MRIAVIGATGNVGTAVLRHLSSRTEVDSVLGIARRLPDTDAAPYADAQWHRADIQYSEVVPELAEALSGCDAVIHLAWLIQPNKERTLLRRVNVDGTRHVLEAAAQAGVRQAVVASSVGVYSPAEDDVAHDEQWPTEGIPGSHYSEDKVAQERVMDEFLQAHPDFSLARLRPGLVFQREAGSEIQRYFAGKLAPVQLLQLFRPAVVPVPGGIRTQAVHADDLAAAYAQAAILGAQGAFNICADDLLDGDAIAKVVSGEKSPGIALPLPAAALRPMIKAAHRAGILPTDEGWLDMGRHVPVMDNSRAKKELHWAPEHSGAQALEELVQGMAAGVGAPSAPLRPRDLDAADQPELPSAEHELGGEVDALLLRQYMSDHLAGATAGTNRIKRMAADYVDTPVFPQISEVAEAIRRERGFLVKLIQRQGFSTPPGSTTIAWLGERVGRLKPNGRPPGGRSPSTLVLEAEMMITAVTGKLHGWSVMKDHAHALGVDPQVFQGLIEDAEAQREQLETVHEYARHRAFRKDRDTFEKTR
ncbi:NAD-dependent epimerase/dehydratase family protein [Nesterenkonia sp. AY15]|uniref:NAD-dependent epimerase/dehydratase family protein n=1 Tax=Nesterenkonia sp. AY15 TaxID=2901139 RepID=UPI001F4CE773|nr:NAD-dependent epimerase/dehydratase family protein [Nesterenkonia sp. AY15]MCH8571421.1 NAD-dependent epimerase/dehydratase family protein [Nesterenkonia sp. AY15]